MNKKAASDLVHRRRQRQRLTHNNRAVLVILPHRAEKGKGITLAKKGNPHAAAGTGSLRKIERVGKNGKKLVYWQGRITIGTDPGTGKQLQKSFSGRTQKEVREAMQAAAVQVNDGLFFEPSKLTFREWFAVWLKDYCNGLKYLTIKQYQNMGDVHILPALGAIKLSQLKSPQIQEFINELSRTGKTVRVKDEKGRITEYKEALSGKTVKNIYAIMKKCLSVAIDQGILKYNPCDRVSLPRVVRKEIQPLTEEQVKKFLTVIKGNQYERLFAVILFTGLREAEALGLTWDSFDEKKNMLHVYRQLQKRVGEDMCFETLKNGKSRDIPLSPYVIKLLQEQRASQIEKRFAAGDSWQGWKDSEEMKTALIFTTDEGTHLGVATVCRHYKQLVLSVRLAGSSKQPIPSN